MGVGGAMRGPRSTMAFISVLGFARRAIWPTLLALIIFASSLSLGISALRLFRMNFERPAFKLVFSAAIGLGIFPYLVLALGTCGFLNPIAFWILIIVCLIPGYRSTCQLLIKLAQKVTGASRNWGKFEWFLGAGIIALIAIGLLSAGTPISDYDTLEYHLGAPAEYLRQGQISFLRHNVYACFPQHVEMINLAGLVLGGNKTVGGGTAVMSQFFFGLLAALAAGLLAQKICVSRDSLETRPGSKPETPEANKVDRSDGPYSQIGLLAAVFFLSCPLLIIASIRAHITLARCFYKGAAVLALFCWLFPKRKDTGNLKWLIVAGISCGISVGVKYSGALFLCLPLALITLIGGLRKGKTLLGRIKPVFALTFIAVLAAAPWLIRHFYFTGNPVYPLLHNIFGARGWSDLQAAKFAAAHSPGSLSGIFVKLWAFLTSNRMGFASPLALVFIPFLLIDILSQAEKQVVIRMMLLLLAYTILIVVLWAFFTHQIVRFLAPVLLFLAVLSAAGLIELSSRSQARKIGFIVTTIFFAIAILIQSVIAVSSGAIGGTLASEGLKEYARRFDAKAQLAYANAVEWVNNPLKVPKSSCLMLVGEAKTYYFDRSLSYSVVFNEHPIEPALKQADENLPRAVQTLKNTGCRYVLINWPELERLSRTYRFEYKGKMHVGYLPQLNLQESRHPSEIKQAAAPLRKLLEASGKKVAQFGNLRGSQTSGRESAAIIEVYRIGP